MIGRRPAHGQFTANAVLSPNNPAAKALYAQERPFVQGREGIMRKTIIALFPLAAGGLVLPMAAPTESFAQLGSKAGGGGGGGRAAVAGGGVGGGGVGVGRRFGGGGGALCASRAVPGGCGGVA